MLKIVSPFRQNFARKTLPNFPRRRTYSFGFGYHYRGPNQWVEFMKANRGRFSNLSELSLEYHGIKLSNEYF
jgi:hypothetical protein